MNVAHPHFVRAWTLVIVACMPLCMQAAGPASKAEPEIVSVEKIWDAGEHNAFTDLIRFKDHWYCTFREAKGHVRGDGTIRVIESTDGKRWTSTALLEAKGTDLRDPKLSITPDGRLMIVYGGCNYAGTNVPPKSGPFKPVLKELQSGVTFSTDGHNWTPLRPILKEGPWLWRVTWHKGRAYGVAYEPLPSDSPDKDNPSDRIITLVTSRDGVNWETITRLDVPDSPNEATVRFLPNGDMIALVRREKGNTHAWIGSSRPPYQQWTWHETDGFIGGPNFIVTPDGQLWAGGRKMLEIDKRTVLARMTREKYEPALTLPSGDDTSYPGLVWHDGLLWMSYYSTHEGKTNIYLAKIKLPDVSK